MSEVTVTIPGRPIPLKRPRLSKKKVYDAQVEIKERIHWEIFSQLEAPNYFAHFKGPITLIMEFHMPIPKYTKRIRKALEDQPHSKRPDIDNLIKFYCDVCTALLYRDDSQVYNITATKIYSEKPKTVITIRQGEDNG